jgi:uroporphyrinogen decarboxylase
MTIHLKRKPDFRRVRTALFCQGEPDRVPLLELGIDPSIKAKVLGRPCRTVSDEIEFARTAGYDYIKLQPGIDMNPAKIFPAGGAQTFQTSEEGPVRRWADEHAGIITTLEEFERYVWPRIEDISYARIEEANRILPDDMAIIGQYGDIYTWVWETMGFETFAAALYEDPDLVAALFEKVGAINYSMFETMAGFERIGALWYSDDLAYTGGLMIAPDFFREYLFPWVKKMGDVCARRNIPFIYHSDGVLWDVMEDLIQCGVKALHPIEPKSMDIAEVKRRAAGRLAVVGNVEVDLLARGTPEQIEEWVKDCITRVGPGGGYLLGSSNSVPEYARFENFIAMVESCDRLGTYPIG